VFYSAAQFLRSYQVIREYCLVHMEAGYVDASNLTDAAFTLSGFDDQEQNRMMFVKTAFQV